VLALSALAGTAASIKVSGLAGVQLTPLTAGRPSGSPIEAGSLWKDTGAIIFAVRRPG